MTESIMERARIWFRKVISKLCGHEYDCCEHITRRCSKCKYVIGEKQ
mgnify:CR=1 FL=1|jgi:hypothetical protein